MSLSAKDDRERAAIGAIFERYGVRQPWTTLAATGLANRIYATDEIVLRIATDHPEAVVDARTESVAAPAARAAGVSTPRLIAFDDSRTIIDRPFSLWERVHGETLGLLKPGHEQRQEIWRETGRQIGRLHTGVLSCSDPQGYLDSPGRELQLESVLKRYVDSGQANGQTAAEIELFIGELTPHVSHGPAADRFVHHDLHDMNIMCDRSGALLAIIDWGDAGWGDPALDFAAVPLDLLPVALKGYGPANRPLLGRYPEARFVWDRLHDALEKAVENPPYSVPLEAYRRFLDRS